MREIVAAGRGCSAAGSLKNQETRLTHSRSRRLALWLRRWRSAGLNGLQLGPTRIAGLELITDCRQTLQPLLQRALRRTIQRRVGQLGFNAAFLRLEPLQVLGQGGQFAPIVVRELARGLGAGRAAAIDTGG